MRDIWRRWFSPMPTEQVHKVMATALRRSAIRNIADAHSITADEFIDMYARLTGLGLSARIIRRIMVKP